MKTEAEIAIEPGAEVEAVDVPDAEVDADPAGEIEAEAEVKASQSHPPQAPIPQRVALLLKYSLEIKHTIFPTRRYSHFLVIT